MADGGGIRETGAALWSRPSWSRITTFWFESNALSGQKPHVAGPGFHCRGWGKTDTPRDQGGHSGRGSGLQLSEISSPPTPRLCLPQEIRMLKKMVSVHQVSAQQEGCPSRCHQLGWLGGLGVPPDGEGQRK